MLFLDTVRDVFYKMMNFPLNDVCTVGKFFGGVWGSAYGCIDGHKFVCLDDFYEDVKNGECLIYSFGIDHDWTFEEMVAKMGCRQEKNVYSYVFWYMKNIPKYSLSLTLDYSSIKYCTELNTREHGSLLVF